MSEEPTIEIEEGHARVPGWMLLAFAILFVSLLIYLGDYLIGAQPSSAQLRKGTPKEANAQPGEAGGSAGAGSATGGG